ALADPSGAVAGSTELPTEALTFALQEVQPARETALPATSRPRWLMYVSNADVHLESVERLTGSNTPVEMTFHSNYLNSGFAAAGNAAGSFAQIPKTMLAFGEGA